MAEAEYDPARCINRLAEQELFKRLLPCQDSVRLLTICDRGGRGKSALLGRLQYICKWEIIPRIPCCRITLDKPSLSGGGAVRLHPRDAAGVWRTSTSAGSTS